MPDGVDSWWFMSERILVFMIVWLSDKWMFIIYKLILWSWVVVFDWIKMMTWIQNRLNDQWHGIINSFIHLSIHSFIHSFIHFFTDGWFTVYRVVVTSPRCSSPRCHTVPAPLPLQHLTTCSTSLLLHPHPSAMWSTMVSFWFLASKDASLSVLLLVNISSFL